MKHLLLKSVLLPGLLLTINSPALANDWWFDVEVLLYKQDQAIASLEEQFPQPATIDTTNTTDLLTPFLLPDIRALRDSLPLCQQYNHSQTPENVPPVNVMDADIVPLLRQIEVLQQQNQQAEASRLTPASQDPEAQIVGRLSVPGEQRPVQQNEFNPTRWLRSDCVFASEQRWLDSILFPKPDTKRQLRSVPTVIDGTEQRFKNRPYLLPQAQFELMDIARNLHRQRGIEPLLHLTWRQPVLFGRGKAEKYRLFGGINFASDYDTYGYAVKEENDNLSSTETTAQVPAADLMERIDEA